MGTPRAGISAFKKADPRGSLPCSKQCRDPQSRPEDPDRLCIASKVLRDTSPAPPPDLPSPFCPEPLAVPQVPSAGPHPDLCCSLCLKHTFASFTISQPFVLCLHSSFSEKRPLGWGTTLCRHGACTVPLLQVGEVGERRWGLCAMYRAPRPCSQLA